MRAAALRADYEQRLELESESPQALTGLAALLLANGPSARAQILLLRALVALDLACAADPLDAAALAQRGGVLAMLGRHAEAVDALEAAAALEPDDYAIAVELSNAVVRGGDFTRAVAALRRAVALAPPDAPNLATLTSNYAAALTRVHRYREACDVLTETLA